MKKTTHLIFAATFSVCLFSCHNTKKQTTVVNQAASLPPAAPPAPAPVMVNALHKSIYLPGDAELTAIKTKYPDTSIEQLKEGYSIYTGWSCTGCHQPPDLNRADDLRMERIIPDMAMRAHITDAQQVALYRYVKSARLVANAGK